MTREISHQQMFQLALESLGDAIEGTIPPKQDLNTYYNLSRDGDGDMGIGSDERGPWNESGQWNFVAKPEESLKSKVEGPKAVKPSKSAH
jgi:Mn-containing catalase